MIVPTPDSLLHGDDPVDVFAKICFDEQSNARWSMSGDLNNRLWNRYKYRGIGNTDVDYWIDTMIQRISYLYETEYVYKLEAWDKLASKFDGLGTNIDFTSSRITSQSVAKNYDPPQTSTAGANATSYLDTQNVNDFTQSTESGLESVTVSDYIDGIRNPLIDLIRDLDDMFYWGM